jgi:hypothetical protein
VNKRTGPASIKTWSQENSVNKSRTVKTSYRKKPAPPALIKQFAAVLANVKALQKTKGEGFTYLQIAAIGNAVR